ncbi:MULTISPECIES: hypothetical protein [unclassified Aureimonas]|uniref:hypothetical protein n=1 Tax=unclassified Aureimonas TaxID=2615206 RepID=UPI00071F88E5|nr:MULTISPECIES: hypothetical protein [unclassified Aureimonas]ALN74047.1 hypothetical protein M673_15075 [Aureimonas sp. AU20]
MPFKRRHHLLGLLLAAVGFATSLPGLPHLVRHHHVNLRSLSVQQLDDDEDREVASALVEREKDESDDDPSTGEAEG